MAAYARRDFMGGAVATTLSSGITSGDTSIAIAASTGWPTGANGDFFIVVDRGNSGEEKIRCASRTGTTLTVQTAGRGSDGTSAAAHNPGVSVEHCSTALDDDEANLAVSKTIGKATAVGQVLVADGTASFAAVQAKTSGQLLIGNGTTLASVAVSGDVTINSSGVTTIGTGKVTSAMILDGTIAAGDIASDAITTAKILNANVTTAKLATGAVTANELGTGAVTSDKILDGTIATADIASGAITSALIADGTIATADIANSAITTALIADANVTAVKIKADAWTSFVPTWQGGSPSLGNGTLSGAYIQYGKTVHFRISLLTGSTTTYGSGPYKFALPAAGKSGVGQSVTCFFNDASVSWPGAAQIASGDEANISAYSTKGGTSGSQVVVGAGQITTSGQQLIIQGTYEAA